MKHLLQLIKYREFYLTVTEKIVFDLYSSGSPILIGIQTTDLSFAELVATNSIATFNGGGATYPNKVFIDLSANRQTRCIAY